MTAMQIIFLVVAAVILGSAVLVVTSRNLIHCALWLIVTLFGVAVLYALLNAGFLAVVQVVIYIGAIAILFIFAVMLTRADLLQHTPQLNPAWWLNAILALLSFGGLVWVFQGWTGFSKVAADIPPGFDAAHVNTWIAGEANLSGYYKTLTIVNVGTFGFHDYMAMAGPRLNMHKAFFHVLGGIDHLSGVTNFYSVAKSSNNVLAGAAGGGVQWNVARHLALRASADYVMSRFGGVMQNNFRVTLGVVYEAGSIRGE